jgi:type IV pilus assembly protein PilX
MKHTRYKQRGAALVIGLILLVVITLLAVVGMNIANTELASATSEQLRLRAFNAAETGLEARLQTLADDATTDPEPLEEGPVGVENSPLNTVTEEAADTYSTVLTYRGEGTAAPRFTMGTFVGFHYSVESTGRSTRNAESVHTAGAFIIASIGENNSMEDVDPDEAPENAIPTTGLGSVSPSGYTPPVED